VNWHGLNWLDLSITLVLLTTTLVALLTGLLRELVSVASLSFGLFVSSRCSGALASFLSRWIQQEDLVAMGAFLGLLVATWTIAGTFGLFLVSILPKGGIGTGSRLFGSFLGLVKGVALTIVVLMVLTVYLPEDNPTFRESRLYPVLIPGARVFADLLPIEQRLILLRRLEPARPEPGQWIEGFV
jgi:membrane protein required for colicin V production